MSFCLCLHFAKSYIYTERLFLFSVNSLSSTSWPLRLLYIFGLFVEFALITKHTITDFERKTMSAFDKRAASKHGRNAPKAKYHIFGNCPTQRHQNYFVLLMAINLLNVSVANVLQLMHTRTEPQSFSAYECITHYVDGRSKA